MERYPALRGDPGVIRKVRLIDDESIALPTAHRVSAVGRRHVVAMWPSVEGNNLKSVKGLRQHHHEFRSLDDLPHTPNIEEAHTQSAERGWKAMHRRVVFVGQHLGVG